VIAAIKRVRIQGSRAHTTSRKSSRLRRLWIRGVPLACLLFGATLAGCSLGSTRLEETHFLAVPSDENINYFRIRVIGKTDLGDAGFRSGWFPATAIDSLWGDASSTGASAARKVEEDIKTKINEKILATKQGYLEAAADPKADPAVIQGWLAAERRVRATAGEEVALPDGALEIEYDPAANLVLRHAGEKLIFVLSSDPDTVIGTISNFSENTQTGATVLRLADVLRQRSVDEVATTEARNDARSKSVDAVVERIDSVAAATDSAARDDLVREVESLRIMLENLR